MRRTIPAALLLALAFIAAVLAVYAATRDREYRRLVAQGETALAHDDTFVAVEAFSGAIALKRDSMLAHLRRGETYRKRGDLAAALRDLRTASNLDPTATRPLEQLGDVYVARQAYARAAQFYEAYLRLDDRSPRLLYKLALARHREGHSDAAIQPLRQALKLDGRIAEVHYLLGLCLRGAGKPEEALRSLQQAARLAPGLVPVREELADFYRSTGRHREEIDQLDTLRGLEPARAERHVALGIAQARTGRTDLAIVTLRAAAERFPQQPLVYAALGRVWLQLAEIRGDSSALRRALEALNAVAGWPSADSEALTLLGRALLLDHDLTGAERVLLRATDRLPVEPSAFTSLASAAQDLGHFGIARDALLRQASLSDDQPDATVAARVAELSLQLNEADAAVTWFERAIALAPTDLSLLARLAEAQATAGRLDAARATLDRALEKDPENPALVSLSRRLRRLVRK